MTQNHDLIETAFHPSKFSRLDKIAARLAMPVPVVQEWLDDMEARGLVYSIKASGETVWSRMPS